MAVDPYAIVAAALEQIIAAEFSELSLPIRHDKIHEALGRSDLGGRVVGIAPVEFTRPSRQAIEQETWAEVRFWDVWPKELKPTAVVDPRIITGYATRFQDAVRRQTVTEGGTGAMWYFDVIRIRFPDDPTGNKSRFVADIRAFGNNQGIVETTD